MSTILILGALAAQMAAPPPPSPTPPAATVADDSERGASTYVDLEAGGGYATNPQFRYSGDTGAGFGRVAIRSVHSRISERTTTVLSGFAQNYFYTRDYGAQQSVDLNARHNSRVSEKLRIFGDLGVAYDKGGQLDTSLGSISGVYLPGGINPPVLLTPGSDFLSVTGRTFRASGHIGAQLALNAREFLTASSGVEHVRFDGVTDTHFTRIPISVGYDRQISTRTTIGARVSAENTEYDGPQSFRSITPELTLQTALSETMTLSGGLGVSFAESDDGIVKRHSTGLAANVSLCSRGQQGTFCGHAAVNQQAATVAGPARTVSVGLDYTRQLDANQTIQFSANASRYSSPILFVTGPTFSRSTYVRAAADYSRRINNRLFGGVNVAARNISQTGPDPKADVSGSLFIRYRLGDPR